MKKGRRQHARGFTLIELMIVVAIVGILSSVAIPSFARLALRAKTAERSMVMMRIKSAVQDYFVRYGRAAPIASDGTPVTTVEGGWNPPYGSGPSSLKVMPSEAVPGWNIYFSGKNGSSVREEIEGALYYRYYFRITEAAGCGTAANPCYLDLWAYGDLDGDASQSIKYMRFQRVNGSYQLTTETPAPGLEDDTTF